MKEREAKKIAEAILLVDRYRKVLNKLDRARDMSAFDDIKMKAIEGDIRKAETEVQQIRAYLRKFGVELI